MNYWILSYKKIIYDPYSSSVYTLCSVIQSQILIDKMIKNRWFSRFIDNTGCITVNTTVIIYRNRYISYFIYFNELLNIIKY